MNLRPRQPDTQCSARIFKPKNLGARRPRLREKRFYYRSQSRCPSTEMFAGVSNMELADFRISLGFDHSNRINTISGVVPTRSGGPHVPVPLDVYTMRLPKRFRP